MEPSLEKRPVQSAEFSNQERENDITTWHRQFCLLSNKLEKHFHGVDEADKLCQRAQKELQTLELKMREKYEIIEKKAARKRELISALIEVKKKLRKELEKAAKTLEQMISDEAQNALSHEASAWICCCVKTGCVVVLNIVAVYALFRVTQLLF